MSLEKASIAWSAKQLKSMIANGKIDFNHIVQRSYVWERKRKSALIESMVLGYPIPPVFAKRLTDSEEGKKSKNVVYCIMDGKQRLSSVAQFLNDEYALTELEPVKYHDEAENADVEFNMTGCKFSDLPEGLQDILNSTMFSVTYFDNLTAEEERELFKRLNAGKPLSTKSRLLASCADIEGLLKIGSHELFDTMLTDKAKDNKNQVTIVMKAWCMMNTPLEEVSFESRSFNPLFESTAITAEERAELDKVFDLISETHGALIEKGESKIAKKLYTETHMISLVPFFAKAIKDELTADLMADWLIDFFSSDSGASVSEDYNTAAGNGSAKNSNIVLRHNALNDSYEEFFEDEEDTKETDTAE